MDEDDIVLEVLAAVHSEDRLKLLTVVRTILAGRFAVNAPGDSSSSLSKQLLAVDAEIRKLREAEMEDDLAEFDGREFT